MLPPRGPPPTHGVSVAAACVGARLLARQGERCSFATRRWRVRARWRRCSVVRARVRRRESQRHPRDRWRGYRWCRGSRPSIRMSSVTSGPRSSSRERRARTNRSAPVGNDGKYSAVATSTAPYTTRAVVMRPINRRRFNGTVVVEWLNVSGGADAAPGLDARTQRTGTRRVRVGRRLRAEGGCGRAQVGRSHRVAMPPAMRTCRTRVTAIPTTSSPRPGKRFVTTPARCSAG